MLPREHRHFPLYYSQEELAELKGSYFLEQLEQKRSDIRRDYHTIVEC
ncbi:MAG: hypothetical protein JST59_02055 [Actinobacteria bacterium]|nr:hypothetical protein [Actinomycetota bacterium]